LLAVGLWFLSWDCNFIPVSLTSPSSIFVLSWFPS